MGQGRADFLLALEAGVGRGIALKLHQRDFDGDRQAGFKIVGLENAGHAAAVDQIGDLEPIVQELAGLKFVAHMGVLVAFT